MPNLKVLSENAGERLDVWLARRFPDYSRAFLQKWVKAGRVKVQGKAPAPSDHLRAGDVIDVVDFNSAAVAAEAPKPIYQDIPRPVSKIEPTVIFEDESLMVLNKPAGLVVHPAPSYRGSTLIDWLRQHMGGKIAKQFTDPERLGLVHRLDKDTSGVLMIAKSVTAQIALSRQFHDRTVRKTYAAWVEGMPTSTTGVITAPVGRSRKDPTRMAVTGSGRASETSFEVKESLKEVTLLTLHPKTGRTHQIRVHTAAMGHPIVGDLTYGSSPSWAERCGIRRPLLHAEQLELVHPKTGKKMIFEAKLPADFKSARAAFRKAALHLALLVMVGVARAAVQGDGKTDPAPAATTKPHHKSTTSSGTSSAVLGRQLRKEIAAVKEQVDALQADVSSMKDQLSGIEAGLTQMDAARRLRDLERALPDVNAKLATATNNAEEARSQAMDASRKVRSLQEASDQFRDQLDKLQRQLIQQRAKTEESAIAADNTVAPVKSKTIKQP
jgi:23S rRNA pseudouridine1911/1915/1917 synthase